MRNYLRDPEFVVNTLCLMTTSIHWTAIQRVQYNPIDERPAQRIEALYARKAAEEKENREEADLPAKRRKRIPRPTGQYAVKVAMTSANKGANPPCHENPFRSLLALALSPRLPQIATPDPATRQTFRPINLQIRATLLSSPRICPGQWHHHSHYFGC